MSMMPMTGRSPVSHKHGPNDGYSQEWEYQMAHSDPARILTSVWSPLLLRISLLATYLRNVLDGHEQRLPPDQALP
jgi:hypothetical protein